MCLLATEDSRSRAAYTCDRVTDVLHPNPSRTIDFVRTSFTLIPLGILLTTGLEVKVPGRRLQSIASNLGHDLCRSSSYMVCPSNTYLAECLLFVQQHDHARWSSRADLGGPNQSGSLDKWTARNAARSFRPTSDIQTARGTDRLLRISCGYLFFESEGR